MEETIAERLDRVLKERELSARSVALEAKLNADAVIQIIHGRSKSPKVSTLSAIAKVLKLPLEYLSGEVDRYPNLAPTVDLRQMFSIALEKIPLSDAEAAKILKLNSNQFGALKASLEWRYLPLTFAESISWEAKDMVWKDYIMHLAGAMEREAADTGGVSHPARPVTDLRPTRTVKALLAELEGIDLGSIRAIREALVESGIAGDHLMALETQANALRRELRAALNHGPVSKGEDR